jgi:hypothetical protein
MITTGAGTRARPNIRETRRIEPGNDKNSYGF